MTDQDDRIREEWVEEIRRRNRTERRKRIVSDLLTAVAVIITVITVLAILSYDGVPTPGR